MLEYDASLHAARRSDFLARMEPGSVAVIPTAPEARRVHDTEYPYRPDTDFFFLTGFTEPDALAVLCKDHADHPTYTLFVRPRDPERETWTGRRAGPDGACKRWGADQAFTLNGVDEKLPELLANARVLYYGTGRYMHWDRRIISLLGGLRGRQKLKQFPPRTLVDPATLLQSQRLVKSDRDIELAQRAADISAQAHREAMMFAHPGAYEYQLQAVIEYEFRKHGASPGYATIVGAGDNATVLHYVTNLAQTGEDDLVLIDAGAEIPALFTGDITRTFPISGRFNDVQRRLYEIVLDAQKQAIDEVKTGSTLEAIHDVALRVLTQGMIDLGLLEGGLDELVEQEKYKPYYMHRTSHWLGMDVHDAGDYYVESGNDELRARELEPGMVLTVEPGLYIPAHDENAPDELKGIGIRIEDDILVTDDGRSVLSSDAPKEISEIEELMKRPSMFQV